MVNLYWNVVWFLLGGSPASEVFMPTFRNALSHLHRQVGVCSTHTYLPVRMVQTERCEASACELWTPGSCPEGSIQHSEHGESLNLCWYIQHINFDTQENTVHVFMA